MIQNDKYEDLTLVYKLLARTPDGHLKMREYIAKHIYDLGHAVNLSFGRVSSLSRSESTDNNIASSESVEEATKSIKAVDPLQWVTSILSLKQKIDLTIEKSMQKDKYFQNDINSALESVFKVILNYYCY